MEDKRERERKVPEREYTPPMMPPAPQPMPQPMPWCPMMQYGFPMMYPSMPMMGEMGCGDPMYGGTYPPLYGGMYGYPYGMPYYYPGMGGINYPFPGMGYPRVQDEE
ncbi:MAG: hypothetical protein GX066_01945 [Clostridiaceae bacterium]|nr:hypothetical protein [Clostridiaceae bacterium]